MPRKQFVADLAAAVQDVSVTGISDVRSGDDDGEFTFICVNDGHSLRISVLIPDLSKYPLNHDCMIFGPEDASVEVASTLADISATGKTIEEILMLVSRKLESAGGYGDHHMLNSGGIDDFEEASDAEDDSEEEYFPGDEELLQDPYVVRHHGLSVDAYPESTNALRQRIRRDLLAAKREGFKIGHLGGLMDGQGCYVSVSIRVAKLGISEEAMQAWQVEPSEYLITLFHYPAGYKTMDDMRSYDNSQAQQNLAMRVGISQSYKPTLQEAMQAFTLLSKPDQKFDEGTRDSGSQQSPASHQGFRPSFISGPLNELLAQRFNMLLKYRYAGMDWNGAELFYNEQILRPMSSHSQESDYKYYNAEAIDTAYPSLVTADHIVQSTGKEHSLPVVGTQFVLRHFVRCTEFCLVCFSKLADDLQAIKPYVCDKPLCLYQYMSLGFGPSIEHEILSQPKVVDLLVSFCYSSARQSRLKDFPAGLALMVPPAECYESEYTCTAPHLPASYLSQGPQPPQNTKKDPKNAPKAMRVNVDSNEIIFQDKSLQCPVRTNDWITFRFDDEPTEALHCRVEDTSYYPTIKIAARVEAAVVTPEASSRGHYMPVPAAPRAAMPKPASRMPRKPNEFRPAKFQIYDQNFDDLPEQNKPQVICLLLDLLPSVNDMRQHLLRRPQSPLSTWTDRICPAALGVLRWIIASNRACILQVDTEDTAVLRRKAEGPLYGMSQWTQFRFAMGAPDKERRFIQSVRTVTDRLRLKFPTIFAWHGSPLYNWHSIIREGLHFKETHHGRAFGHGVYHSLDLHTSMGYTGGSESQNYAWPRSELKISQALALNEICNAPDEFVSRSPHLVVAQLDWIQTRYLFVSSAENQQTTSPKGGRPMPLDVLAQDPSMTPRGSDGNLVIPMHAVSGDRRPKALNTTQHKRQKASGMSKYDASETIDDDSASVTTLEEDRIILEDSATMKEHLMDAFPTPNSINLEKAKDQFEGFFHKSKTLSKPITDYLPGSLDYSTLPMLQQPSWASSTANKCLMRDFKALIKTQKEQSLHELGWHIDEDKIDNMYQWVVELHSFDTRLPLAQDMKNQDIKSVVLELRFGKDYPMAPPFVRVIRPRFLSFAAGGGGHVTAGGAMCMELLTNDGWSAASSIESVLVQVRMAITSLDPKPARLERGGRHDYGVGEAVDAYIRACSMHGWTVPFGFKETAYGGAQF